MTMKLACCTILYSRYALGHAIDELANIGYTGVEVWTGRPQMYRQDLDAQLPELRKKLQSNALEVPNVLPAQLACPVFLASTNERVRADSVQHMKYVIDNAKKLSAPSVNLCSGPSSLDENIEDNFLQLERSIGEILVYAERKKIDVLIEPGHRYETDLIRTTHQALQIMQKFSSERLGLLLDCGHLAINGEPVDAIFASIPRGMPLHLHVNDNDAQHDSHSVPGTGRVDIPAFLRAAARYGYNGFISVELLANGAHRPYEMAEQSYQYCKKLLDMMQREFR